MPEMNEAKKKLLKEVFLLYWKWDIMPNLDNPEENTPEYFILDLYDSFKENALSKYNWRSAIKYQKITCEEPEISNDKRYKYSATLPEDFLKAVGFWQDEERNNSCHNSVDIVGNEARTNLKEFTLGYINKNIEEDKLDFWVRDFIGITIATEGADIAGVPTDVKNFLISKLEVDLIKLGNLDYEMAHKDEISSSIHQFEWC